MLTTVSALMVYADGVALNIFPAPVAQDLISYVTLAAAVALTAFTLGMDSKDEREDRLLRTFDVQVTETAKETNRAKENAALPITTQSKRQNQPSIPRPVVHSIDNKKIVIDRAQETVKIICPACRKEFILPSYLADYVLDFGPPKQTNRIINCHYCETLIRLKQKGSTVNF